MRDIGVLKERIEYAERHLRAAHKARERESATLMQMWQEIRDRFDGQENQIAEFRQQVSDLTTANDELSKLVDRLISTVEGSVKESADETVPEISRLASELLSSEPPRGSVAVEDDEIDSGESVSFAEIFDDKVPEVAGAALDETDDGPVDYATFAEALDDFDSDEPLDLDEALELEEALEASGFNGAAGVKHDTEGDREYDSHNQLEGNTVKPPSASPGIRNLISRIEGAVNNARAAAHEGTAGAGSEQKDDLARELEEIESLRNELNGLRNKISGGQVS